MSSDHLSVIPHEADSGVPLRRSPDRQVGAVSLRADTPAAPTGLPPVSPRHAGWRPASSRGRSSPSEIHRHLKPCPETGQSHRFRPEPHPRPSKTTSPRIGGSSRPITDGAAPRVRYAAGNAAQAIQGQAEHEPNCRRVDVGVFNSR